jgi:Tol biopolymer transport system component/beta-lactamase regulating signal transducer with metallopeptidase domain
MEAFNIILSPFFQWLLKTTVQASVLICLILLVKIVFRQKLPVRWHYYLWLLLLIRLALPWSPQSRISIFNLTPQSSSRQESVPVTISNESDESMTSSSDLGSDAEQAQSSQGEATGTNIEQPESLITSEPPTVPAATGTDKLPSVAAKTTPAITPDFCQILSFLWFTGVLALASYISMRNIILWRAIKKERQVTDQQILELLEDCKMQMRIQTVVGVVVTDKVKSPALFGFIRPRLLLPQGLLEVLNLDELQYVFLHELAHLRRHDIYLGWMVSLLQVLHWFNPLIWFAFRRMRTDQELACDALALSTMSSEEPAQYGKTLVNLFERFSHVSYVPSIAGILEDKSQLERRIKMITKFKKNSYQFSPVAAILIIILACISLPNAISTKASQSLATKSAPPISLRRIWAGSDVDVEGAISPDGRYISYVDWETGDLAVYEIATGNKRRLTNKGSWDESNEFALFSRWSPDGKQIVYDWYNKEYFIDLRIVGLDGSEPRILYRNKEVTWAQTYDWAPDGKHILACFSKKEKPNEIVLVSVADGSVRILKTLDDNHPHNMVFSPDGRYIVYDFPQKGSSPESDIFLLLADGSHEIPLVEHPADDRFLDWTPDGKNILFTSDRTGSPCMWSIAIADGIVQGVPRLIKPNTDRKLISMGFTKDGSFYYGCGGRGMSDVYTVKLDLQTGKVLSPPKRAVLRFEGHNGTGNYSPDGKYLAYVSHRGIRHQILCIRSLETGQEREFPSELKRILGPRWSPDGNSILIAGMDYDVNRYGIYQVDPKTGIFTPVMLPSKDFRFNSHEWSRDGKSFFIGRTSVKDKHSQIMLREIKSGEEKEIYRTSGLEQFRLACSPDGKWLAFINMRNDGADGALKVLPSVGGESRELYKCEPKKEGLWALKWTPDGKYILFIKREIEQKEFNLWRIPVEGGEPQKIDLGINIIGLSIHPDGQHIAIGSRENQPAEVWVMKNFLPEVPVAKPANQIALRQVWAGSDVDDTGEPSPDGRYISHMDWVTGDLAIYDIATGKTRRLTNKGSWEDSNEFVESSRWSPDSKQIAYAWYNKNDKYDLRVLGIDGAESHVLLGDENYDWIRPCDWSKDGKFILARLLRKDNTEIAALVSVTDGAVQVVKELRNGCDHVMFAPEEDGIVYDAPPKGESGNHDIFVLSIKNGEESALVKHPSHDYVLGWGPDGKHLLFASDRMGDYGAWLLRVTDGRAKGFPELIKEGIGDVRPLGFTQAGAYYYMSQQTLHDVFIARLNMETGQVLSEPMPVQQTGATICHDWSPDGQYIAYCTQRPNESQVIHIRTLATGQERILADNLPYIRWLRWSLDGQSILIDGYKRGDSQGVIRRIDVQTGQGSEIVRSETEVLVRPELSPDEKTLFYGRGDPVSETHHLVARDIESGHEESLFHVIPPDRLMNSALSPDGQRFVLSILRRRGASRTSVLKILSVTGGEPKELIQFDEADRLLGVGVTWMPDSRSVLFWKWFPGGKELELWRISTEGGEPRRLWSRKSLGHLRVHPDGERIAFNDRSTKSKVWVMENFLPETPVVKHEPTPTLRQIEVRGRGSVHSRPSFDGKYMLDVDRETGNLIICERTTSRKWKLPITSDPNAFVYESRMSPDSTRAAFLQFNPVEEDFNLCIINSDGSGQRTLMDSRQIAGYFNMDAWSPDGKYIFGRLERDPMELIRVSTNDGSVQVIKKFERGTASIVQVSSDGHYLAYSYAEQKTSNPDIFVFDLEQNQETPLVTHPASDKLLGWTPDGQHIFFTSDRNETWDGWLLRVVDGKPHGLPEMIKAGIGDVNPIGFTKDGSFYYGFRHQAWNVYTATLDQNTGQVISEPMPVRDVGKDICPDWSPDGRYLAYLSEPDRSKPQVIRIRTLATSQERELKIDLPRFEWLRWCPDSRHLLITNFSWNSPSMVYKVDVETSTYIPVVSSEQRSIRQAELSADGKTLAYRIRGSGNATWLIARNIETGTEKELLQIGDVMDATSLALWSLSPNGKQVALSIRQDKVDQPHVLKVVTIETGESKTLVAEMGLFLLWSSDGHDLLFTKNGTELWRVAANGGKPQRIWEWKEIIWGPRIHPDGQHLAFFSGGYVSEMWVMENFLPEGMVAARR